MSKFLLSAATLFCLTGLSAAADTPADGAKAKPYPLTTCIVTDEKLDEDAVSKVYNGQEIKVCCKKCFKEFDKDQAKYLKKLAGDPKPGDKHGDHDHKPAK